MTCNLFETLIDRYLDGELNESAEREFLAHRDACKSCRDSLRFSESIRTAMHTMPPIDVPTDFLDNVMSRIDKKPEAKVISFPALRIPQKYCGIAACLVLAVALSFSGYDLLGTPDIETGVTDPVPTQAPVAEVDTDVPTPTEAALPPQIEEPAADTTTVAAPVVTAPSAEPVKKPSSGPVIKPTAKPKDTATETPKDLLENSNGKVVIASAVDTSYISQESVLQAEKDVDYRRSYTMLEQAAENKAIANPATLGKIGNVNINVEEKKKQPTGAYGNSVMVSREDEATTNGLLKRYFTRPVGEFFVLSEYEYGEFLKDLDENGIDYRNFTPMKSESEDIIFKIVVS